jgi:hypothetical protein
MSSKRVRQRPSAPGGAAGLPSKPATPSAQGGRSQVAKPEEAVGSEDPPAPEDAGGEDAPAPPPPPPAKAGPVAVGRSLEVPGGSQAAPA